MREDKFTKLYDELFQIKGVSFGDVVLLSLIISLCHYAKWNEIYLKSKTLMRRFRRSESQVKRMIKSLETKKLVEVYSKGYAYYKMRHIQVKDQRILRLIGEVRIAPSIESQIAARSVFYEKINDLLSRDRITEQETKEVGNIPYARMLYCHVLFRALRELKGCFLKLDSALYGYLKRSIVDDDLRKIADLKRVVTAVKDAKIQDETTDISIVYRVVDSLRITNENFVAAPFSYEKFEHELEEAKSEKRESKVISFMDYQESQRDRWRVSI